MNRVQMSVFALCAVVLVAALTVMPVAAQEQSIPQTISDANELAQSHMHFMDQKVVAQETEVGAIANRNELAIYLAEIADHVGVAPAYQWNQWYVQYNQVCDCVELADYMNHVVDINAQANRT